MHGSIIKIPGGHIIDSNINFLESIPGACVILNEDLIILHDNAAAQQLYSSPSLRDKNFKALIAPNAIQHYNSNEDILRASEHLSLDGEHLFVGVKYNRVTFNDKPCYFLLINNLSEIKQNQIKIAELINETHSLSESILKTQNELVKQEKRLHSLVHSQLNFLIRTSPNGMLTFCNNSFKSLFQVESSTIDNTHLESLLFEEDIAVFKSVLENCLKEPQQPVMVQLRMVLPNKKIVHIEWEFYSIVSDSKYEIEIQAVGNNITEKKNTEQELQKALILFSNVFNESSDALLIVQKDSYKIIDCNKKAAELFEVNSREALIGKIGYDFEVKTPNYEPLEDLNKRIEKNAIKREIQYKTEKGNFFWGDVAVKTISTFPKQTRLIRITDITDRKEKEKKISTLLNDALLVNQELKSKNKALNKVNTELDNFVYRVSHDLRAPIASTLGLLDLANMEIDKSKVNEYLLYIKKSMNKLDDLISDILDYSRNNRMEVQYEKIALKNLINSLVAQYQFSIEEKNIRLINDISEEAVVFSDIRRLTIILNNLISNAIRYHNPYEDQKYVKIEWNNTDEAHVIAVSDNGIGISNKYQSDIFKMFFRANNSMTSGSGIGLYIVKEALDKLNGNINVNSIEGKGSTFSITLPLL